MRDYVLLGFLLLHDLEYRFLLKEMLDDAFAEKVHVGLIISEAPHAFLHFGHLFCDTCAFAPRAPFGLARLEINMFREFGFDFVKKDVFNIVTRLLQQT